MTEGQETLLSAWWFAFQVSKQITTWTLQASMQIKPDNQNSVSLGDSNKVISIAVDFNCTHGFALAREKSSLHHKA